MKCRVIFRRNEKRRRFKRYYDNKKDAMAGIRLSNAPMRRPFFEKSNWYIASSKPFKFHQHDHLHPDLFKYIHNNISKKIHGLRQHIVLACIIAILENGDSSF